jgi:CTP:molybdopterin cytidylyltransferase MocA
VNAVITAGGRIEGAFAQAAGTNVKALAPVGGSTMLERVIDALRGAGASEIAVVGGEDVRAAARRHVDRLIDESPSGGQNLLRALRAWPPQEALLYATSDLPYLSVDAVRDFLLRIEAGAVGVALVAFGAYQARFADAPPTGITLRGERVVNGGLFWIPAGAAERIAAVATRFFDARKEPWRMAGLVSPVAVIRYFFGRLGVADLEAAAARALRVPARAARGCAPELAFDVDTLAEYRYACAHR